MATLEEYLGLEPTAVAPEEAVVVSQAAERRAAIAVAAPPAVAAEAEAVGKVVVVRVEAAMAAAMAVAVTVAVLQRWQTPRILRRRTPRLVVCYRIAATSTSATHAARQTESTCNKAKCEGSLCAAQRFDGLCFE